MDYIMDTYQARWGSGASPFIHGRMTVKIESDHPPLEDNLSDFYLNVKSAQPCRRILVNEPWV